MKSVHINMLRYNPYRGAQRVFMLGLPQCFLILAVHKTYFKIKKVSSNLICQNLLLQPWRILMHRTLCGGTIQGKIWPSWGQSDRPLEPLALQILSFDLAILGILGKGSFSQFWPLWLTPEKKFLPNPDLFYQN